MNRATSMAVAVIGIILLVYGLNASGSAASNVSRTFTGNPTDKAIWLIIGGVAGILIGGGTLFLRWPRD